MKSKFFFVFLLLCNIAVCQKSELGKVTVKELEQKFHPIDSSASAAVLFNTYKTTFSYSNKKGFSVVHNFEIRIKIYKKEGLEYANYEIPYYIGYENIDQETIVVNDAVTYNLQDGKIEKTKLNGQGTFKEKVNKNWKTITIAMPNVKAGSIVEFSYKLRSQNLTEFPRYFFQRDIPVNYSEYSTAIPAIYVYKPVIKGYLDIKTTAKVQAGGNLFTDDYGQSQRLNYNEIFTSHIIENVPAIKEEPYVDNRDNYRSSIDYELEVIKDDDGGEDENLAQTWEGVAKNIFKDKDFGNEIELKGYFENEIRPVIEGLNNEERVKALHQFLKTKMNWNNEFGIFADKGVKQAYLDRTGNAAEINFILISMLNSAGIAANPVLVSTVKNGIAVYPNRTAFNYVIASAYIDGKNILLDATAKNTTPGILPEYVLNWTGRLIKKDGSSEEIDLTPGFPSKKIAVVMGKVDGNGQISGKTRIIKSDYNALDFRNNHGQQDQDNYLQYLENSLKGIEISNYTVENVTIPDKPIQESFDFKSNDLTENIGGKIYISPLLFLEGTKNPFVQEKRSLPLFFGYPRQNKYTVTLDIPDGYTIESMPESVAYATGENVASFKYTILQTGSKVQIACTSDTNMMLVSAAFYPVIKDFYQKVSNKLNEKIVIKKI